MSQPAAGMKKILGIQGAPNRHWVGDGFPVHGMFGYSGAGVAERSPFLMLDYAAPTEFTPNAGQRRGVGAHPHRGIETVTIVYAGEVEHRDSTGAGGIIGAGDVQWMTAGGGIIHEEFHSPAYSASGGPFEMVQLWVNLPAAQKMTPAHYQSIPAASIPLVELPAPAAGSVRVIAGSYAGHTGPARTHTPMNVWDIRLSAGQEADVSQEEGWSTLIVVLAGAVHIHGSGHGASDAVLKAAEIATLSSSGSGVHLRSSEDSKILLLAGRPINEPVVGYGPFVMNSKAEIQQAIEDYQSGQFGAMPSN